MKSLKQNVVAFVKHQIADTKRSIHMLKANKAISIFHILEKHIGSFHGYKVYRDDIVVQACTGSYGYEPNAIVIAGEIIVNTAFEAAPDAYQEAILFHELAHIEFKHQPNPILYPIQARLGFGYGLQIEYEADEFSVMKGSKMLQALEYLSEHHQCPPNRAMRLRLKRLRSICNA